MEYRELSNKSTDNLQLFQNIILPHVGQRHLDFGCGYGFLTSYLADSKRQTEFIGYDINKNLYLANQMISSHIPNISYTDSLEKINNQLFDSISLTFVYHEIDTTTLKNVSKLLKPKGKIIIIDYQMKNMGQEEFVKKFNSELEKKEIEKLGLYLAWQLHTSTDSSDCSRDIIYLGLKIIEQKNIPEKPNLFQLVAQKE